MPSFFDGLIDIQHVPDSSLITQAQTSGANKCKWLQKPVGVIHLGKPFVLVIVITISRKHKSAKFINRKYPELRAR